MRRKAFTLVELLVVIAIIGLLSTVAVVSLNAARVKARNVIRIGDIRQLISAFSMGLDANGQFPSSGGDGWVCVSSSCYGGWNIYLPNGTVDAFLAPFMAKKPADPSDNGARGHGGYVYNGAWGGGGSFPGGVYISYLLEPTAACALGALWSSTPNYIQCLYKLD